MTEKNNRNMWVYIQILFRTSSLLVLLHWLHLKNYRERTSVDCSQFSVDEWITHADLHAVLNLLCLVLTLTGLGDLVKYLHTVLKPWVKLQCQAILGNLLMPMEGLQWTKYFLCSEQCQGPTLTIMFGIYKILQSFFSLVLFLFY